MAAGNLVAAGSALGPAGSVLGRAGSALGRAGCIHHLGSDILARTCQAVHTAVEGGVAAGVEALHTQAGLED